jgi:hypothetical protein
MKIEIDLKTEKLLFERNSLDHVNLSGSMGKSSIFSMTDYAQNQTMF